MQATQTEDTLKCFDFSFGHENSKTKRREGVRSVKVRPVNFCNIFIYITKWFRLLRTLIQQVRRRSASDLFVITLPIDIRTIDTVLNVKRNMFQFNDKMYSESKSLA